MRFAQSFSFTVDAVGKWGQGELEEARMRQMGKEGEAKCCFQAVLQGVQVLSHSPWKHEFVLVKVQ